MKDCPSPSTIASRWSPSPSKLGEEFSHAARRLSGLAGLLFGWLPETFWAATPAELAALADALRGDGGEAGGGTLLARLMEEFPDG